MTESPASKSGLCLELISPRSELLLGEPVLLAAVLRNCSDRAVEVRDLLAPEFSLLRVLALRPGEDEEILYAPAVRRDGRGKRPISLAPGEYLAARVPIYFGRDGWFMTQTGQYRLRAEYPVWPEPGEEETLASEPLELTVNEPESSEDRRAAETFMSPPVALFFYLGGGDPEGEGGEGLRRLAQEHAGTPWANYSRLGLAVDAARRGSRPESTGECERAVAEIQPLLGEIEDPLLAARGLVSLKDCLRHLGREAEGEATVDSYFETFPDAKALPGLRRWIEE